MPEMKPKRGKPKARSAPRPTMPVPAPDHDRDPADPEPAPAAPEPPRAAQTGGTRTTKRSGSAGAAVGSSAPPEAPADVQEDAGGHVEPDTGAVSVRTTMLITPLQDRALKLARIDDGIPAGLRVRAMIALYRENARWRAAVDRQAKRMR